jgi:hypothetical protein
MGWYKVNPDIELDWDNIQNKPVIPAAQIQSDWNQSNSSALDYIKNKPSNIGGGSGFWSGANTGGDCNTVTTPGAYSGSWINSPPGATWGTLLVLPSDVGTSYRQQIFIPENGSQMYFRGSLTSNWLEVSTGAGGAATLPPLPWRLDGNIAILQQYTSPAGTQGLYIVAMSVPAGDTRNSVYPTAAFEVSNTDASNARCFAIDNDGDVYHTISDRAHVVGGDPFFLLARPSYRNPAYRKGFRMRYDSANNRLYVEKNSTGGSSNWTAATWNSAGYFS